MRPGAILIILTLRICEAEHPSMDGILTKDEITEDRQTYLDSQIKKFYESHGSFRSLPVHSRSSRPSSSCPGVLEEEILYRFTQCFLSLILVTFIKV